MRKKLLKFLEKVKYEILLFGLVQHLFIGIFLKDLEFYTRVIWPINIIILGITSIGVFYGKGIAKNVIRILLTAIVFSFPVFLPFLGNLPFFMSTLNISYVIFFIYLLYEVLKFLIKPSYINRDIISAAACGYFLLIEINVFLMQYFYYRNHNAFKGIDISQTAGTYIDFVYLSSITLTSIGFGDITPNTYYTKLVLSFLGIAGHFYNVVLVGIIISKFTAQTNNK